MIEKIIKWASGGALRSVENIASEWLQTDMERAEAKTLMIKALDPNGIMRRDLSKRVTTLYTIYIVTTLVLLAAESFGLGPVQNGELAVSAATNKITELFTPITTLFGVIISASFGVNYANVKQGK